MSSWERDLPAASVVSENSNAEASGVGVVLVAARCPWAVEQSKREEQRGEAGAELRPACKIPVGAGEEIRDIELRIIV